MEGIIGFDECLLEYIFRIFNVLRVLVGQRINAFLVGFEQHLKSLSVALLGCLDQIGVVHPFFSFFIYLHSKKRSP